MADRSCRRVECNELQLPVVSCCIGKRQHHLRAFGAVQCLDPLPPYPATTFRFGRTLQQPLPTRSRDCQHLGQYAVVRWARKGSEVILLNRVQAVEPVERGLAAAGPRVWLWEPGCETILAARCALPMFEYVAILRTGLGRAQRLPAQNLPSR